MHLIDVQEQNVRNSVLHRAETLVGPIIAPEIASPHSLSLTIAARSKRGQAATPLAQLTAGRVPLINHNPRRDAQKKAGLQREALAQRRIGQLTQQAHRYHERSTVEWANRRLQDEFGGRHVRGYTPTLWRARRDSNPRPAA